MRDRDGGGPRSAARLCFVLAGWLLLGCSSGNGGDDVPAGAASGATLRVPGTASVGMPVPVGVSAGGRRTVGPACFTFGDGQPVACRATGFAAPVYTEAGRYTVRAEWWEGERRVRQEREILVTALPGLRFDFEAGREGDALRFGAVPFPNDLHLDARTGRVRVSGLERLLPVNHARLRVALATMDGFGTSTAVHFPVSGGVPDALLVAGVEERSAEYGSPVFLIDLDPASPEFRTRHPVTCVYDAERGFLTIRPMSGHPLRPRTRYAAVVTTAMGNASGAAVGSDGFREMVDRLGSGAPPREDLLRAYGGVLELLLGEPDIPVPEALAMVSPFTTQSTYHALLDIRERLRSLPPPQARWTRVFDDPEELDWLLGDRQEHASIGGVAHGLYASAQFQTPDEGITVPDDQQFQYDEEGRVRIDRMEELAFTLIVPAGPAPSPGGYPVIVFQHGISSNRVAVLTVADRLARDGFACIAIDAAAHGSRSVWASSDTENNQTGDPEPDGFPDTTVFSQVSSAEFFAYLLNFVAVRDHYRQTVADLLQLVRLVRNPDLDLGPLGDVSLDGQRLYLLGDSLGGMFCVMLMAVEPGVRAAVLNVTGGGLLTELVIHSPDVSQWVLPFLPFLYAISGVDILDPYHPALNLMQAVIDPGDPINYARHLIREPLVISGVRSPPGDVLQIMVEGDETVPNPSSEALARGLGVELLVPFARPVQGVREVRSPARGNLHNALGTATGVLVQCSPAAHSRNLSDPIGVRDFVPWFPYPEGYDEPFPRLPEPVEVRQPYLRVQDQVVRFLRTEGQAGVGEVRAMWTPVLDWDDDGLEDDEERALGTDPAMRDSDGDGTPDGEEVAAGTDPLDPGSFPG